MKSVEVSVAAMKFSLPSNKLTCKLANSPTIREWNFFERKKCARKSFVLNFQSNKKFAFFGFIRWFFSFILTHFRSYSHQNPWSDVSVYTIERVKREKKVNKNKKRRRFIVWYMCGLLSRVLVYEQVAQVWVDSMIRMNEWKKRA